MLAGLNPQKIQTLGQDLDSPHIAVRFLSDFLDMLPKRLQSIRAAVAEQDDKSAMDAVLSLTITASMTGAVDTEACCLRLQSAVRNQDFGIAHDQVEMLAELVERLHRAAPMLLANARDALGLGEDLTAYECAAA